MKIEPGRFLGDDGVALTRYEAGVPDGPPLVFLSGLGGGFEIFRPLLERFAPHYRLIGWDYRGLYSSDTPPSLDTVAIPQQARDLRALLVELQVDRPVLIGWSMGVQVGLELLAAQPRRARGFVGIHGTAGRPLASAFDSGMTQVVAPGVLALLGKVGRGLDEFGPKLVQTRGVARTFVGAVRSLGWMAPGLDVDGFRDVADSWIRLDFEAYAETFRRLGEHDAWDRLPDVSTPTLLVAGGRDRFTPAHLAQRMAAEMPDAELAHIDDATHFGLLEAPDEIGEQLARFLRDRLGLPA